MLWKNLKAAPARRKAVGQLLFVSSTVKVVGWGRLKIGDFTVGCDDTWFIVNRAHPSIFI